MDGYQDTGWANGQALKEQMHTILAHMHRQPRLKLQVLA